MDNITKSTRSSPGQSKSEQKFLHKQHLKSLLSTYLIKELFDLDI